MILGNVVLICPTDKSLTHSDLVDVIAEIMSENFGMIAEDGSVEQVLATASVRCVTVMVL